MRRARRIAGTVVGVGVLACAAVLVSAQPASAHGAGGVEPSNLETRVRSTEPRVPGITLRVVDLGDRLELTNDTKQDVVVYGYDEEPYLRIGPRGTFENVRSPAVYLNRSRYDTQRPPKSADPNAAPRWRRVSDSMTARWHDHRAHWMGRDDPPVAKRDPGSAHLVQEWTVLLRQGGRVIEVGGDVRWVPGPSPWPWVLGALAALATVLVLFGSRHIRTAVVVALGVLVVSESAHVVGGFGATTASAGAQLAASLYSLGGVALCVVALVWVVRRGLYGAAPLVLLAGMFVALGGGLAEVNTLGHSQLPTTSAGWVARLEVALALGLGLGLAIVAALMLRPSAARGPARTRAA